MGLVNKSPCISSGMVNLGARGAKQGESKPIWSGEEQDVVGRRSMFLGAVAGDEARSVGVGRYSWSGSKASSEKRFDCATSIGRRKSARRSDWGTFVETRLPEAV